MPGSALARGAISSTFADSSASRAGSTLNVVTRAYMGGASAEDGRASARQVLDGTPKRAEQC